jgi:hypothetical protein
MSPNLVSVGESTELGVLQTQLPLLCFTVSGRPGAQRIAMRPNDVSFLERLLLHALVL